MTRLIETRNVTGSADSMAAVQLLRVEGKANTRVENPQQVMDEIQSRATKFSSVLEDILQEPHDRPDWGLNE